MMVFCIMVPEYLNDGEKFQKRARVVVTRRSMGQTDRPGP